MVKKIILVFKTHFDIGFTDLSSNVIDKYSDSMLKEVIATCKATQHMGKQQYVWTMPSWPLKVSIEKCSPDLRKELDELIERGQIVWHALPYTTHTDFCSAEEFIEGLRFGKELSEQYKKPYTVSAKMTDVPGHGIMLPSILSGAGVKFLHLGSNEFATPPKLPSLFFWQSLSGERVLTMYNKGGYGTTLTPPEDWDFPVWMALMQTHDNCGPQSAAMIEKMVDSIHKEYPDVEVVCGTMDDFYHDLVKCDLKDIPVVTKDLADTWIHGVGTYPKEVSIIRKEREKSKRLQALYAKQVLLDSEITEDSTMELLDRYYESVNLFGEHTWGADVKTWLGPDRVYPKEEFLEEKKKKNYQFMENSWLEQKERAVEASSARNELKILIEKNSNQEIYFFNPNNANYTGWVILEDQNIDLSRKGLALNDEILPAIRIEGEWACYVENLPPFTTVPITIKEKTAQMDDLIVKEDGDLVSVENHRYILTFSKINGEILGLYDKKLKTMHLEKQKDKAVFSYQYDRYGIEDVTSFLRDYAYRFSTWGIQDYGREAYPECDHKTYSPKYQAYTLDGHTITFQYQGMESVERYGDAQKVSLELTLPPVGDEIFVRLNLTNKQETPYIESGSFLFPFANAQSYRINKSNSVLDPSKDIQENANHVFYCLENYMSAENKEHGLCIVTKDVPLVSLGDTGVYKYRKNYQQPEEPIAFFNLFNNMWGTNFPQWIGGDFSFRFVLFGYEKAENHTLLEKAAQLQEGIEVTGHHFESRMEVLPEHMQLINVRKISNGIVLRFKDLAGENALRKLQIKGYSITPINLMNEKIGEEVRDEIAFQTNPYGICSFLLHK
ncbi:MAG: hypothetical protein GX306_09170 [Clostridiales bacterium]|jgi:alpha-mannosidase|nr:hypothetical protein [Clostridiales bacterium]